MRQVGDWFDGINDSLDIYTNKVIFVNTRYFTINNLLLALEQIGNNLGDTQCQLSIQSSDNLLIQVNLNSIGGASFAPPLLLRSAGSYLHESGEPRGTVHSTWVNDIIDSPAINQETTSKTYWWSKCYSLRCLDA